MDNDENAAVLCELFKAKENIKRKFIALKSGETDIQTLLSQTFKPIVDPLNKLSNNNNKNNKNSQSPAGVAAAAAIAVNDDRQNYNPVQRYPSTTVSEDVDVGGDDVIEKHQAPTGEVCTDDYRSIINGWFSNHNRDLVYGPRKRRNGIIVFGDKEVDFFRKPNTLVIENRFYHLSPGVIELIFSINPTVYTKLDLLTYKSILIVTSSFRQSERQNIASGGTKCKNIIAKLFSTVGRGGGRRHNVVDGFHKRRTGDGRSVVSLQKHNLIYWDDPNELVSRLRLLLSSRTAGNTGVSNEILSIFEELLEAGLIKKIPNV